jgi:cytochrome c biogenesis protein CcmG, thiol:disulfide interchange protein DsbE
MAGFDGTTSGFDGATSGLDGTTSVFDGATGRFEGVFDGLTGGRAALQRRVKGSREILGFSPGASERLKAHFPDENADAALKRPIFHGGFKNFGPELQAVHSSVRKFFILSIAVLTLLTASCFHSSRPQRIGQAAPDFSVQDSDHKIALSQFRGDVVVLNFWATWCPPCQQETPSLVSLQDRTRAKGVVVLGVSIDVDDEAYHRFLKQHGINFVTVRDPDQKVSDIYGTHGWPETYIIDRQGVLRRKVVGPIDWTAPDVIEFLNKL